MQKIIKTFKGLFFITGLFLYGNFASAEALILPKDAEGWTIFTPSDDSRIMYVSADGNDSTGTVYEDSDAALGGNPFNPTGPINPFATYVAAFANTRDGYSDWILFKRGDTFYQTIGSSVRRGRAIEEPFLVGAYGSTGASPILKTGTSGGISIFAESQSSIKTKEYMAFQGIHFYAHTRNPNDPDYVGNTGGKGMNFGTYNPGNMIKNILVEGCVFRYYKNNTIQAGGGADFLQDITVRRNIITYTYSEDSHAQGLSAAAINNFMIEENVFYHNGWLIQALPGGFKTDGQATIHNHNIYVAGDTSNVSVIRNISISPSSIHFKMNAASLSNMIIDNNLGIDGEIALDASNNYHDDEFRIINPVVSNNVFSHIGRSNPTGRNVSWGFWILGWDGGELYNNIMLSSAWLYKIGDQSRNVDIHNNILYQYPGAYAGEWSFPGESTSITVRDNYIDMTSDAISFFMARVPTNGLTFSGNQYYSPGPADFRFDGAANYTTEQWQANFEPTATFVQRAFTDPTRTIERYQANLGGEETLDAFITAAISQDRYNWDVRYSTDEVNSWIRAGFVAAEFRADVDGSLEINTTDALLTLRNSLGLSMSGTAWQPSATTGDVNCDGVSNSTDALLILRYSLGLGMSETTWCD